MASDDTVNSPVTFADVESAARAIVGQVVRTPMTRSETLSAITGCEVWVKFENLQFTASFKERGALNRLLALTPHERALGVVTMSAGNHAQAVAHHATRMGMAVTVVMPETTPNLKVARTGALGADVIISGKDFEAAAAYAAALSRDRGLVLIPPFDDPLIIAGQGTVALEMLTAGPAFDTLVVPVGGGGLLAGCAVAARHLSPDTRIVGAQSEAHAPVAAMFGHPTAETGPTIADGIAVSTPGTLTTSLIRSLADDVVAVPEATIEEAICLYLEIEKVVAEGAGAVSLATLLHDPGHFAGQRVGLILSGGNIDLRVLASVIMRGLVTSGRLARLRVELPDRPGGLGQVGALIGSTGANIVEVTHGRHFESIGSRAVVVALDIETRGRPHTKQVVEALAAAGFPTAAVQPDRS